MRTALDAAKLRFYFIVPLLALIAACATTGASRDAREALAPTGTLRIAVYPGSPTSLVESAPPERMRGVTVDLGRALATQLGMPSQVVVYPRVAEVVAAIQRGEADFTITNATPERQRLVDFAPPLVDLELGVLIPAGSRVSAVERIDQSGVTVGVSQGSSSERVLAGRLAQSKLRTFPSLDAAAGALQRGEIDAFATNKGILFELADKVPGARVLDGRWGTEHLAPATVKGRAAAGVAYLEIFARDVKGNGELQRAVERAGLRGTVPAAP
jgi:polar amino acid transport system substrate-binding protein